MARGRVFIIEERCKGCRFCVEFCPHKVLAVSERYNAKGYRLPCVVDEEACTHCGLCEMICPEFAIYSLPVDEKEPEPQG